MGLRCALMASAAAGLWISTPAAAQITPTDPSGETQSDDSQTADSTGSEESQSSVDSRSTEDGTIVVTGTLARSLQQAMTKKRNSPVVIEAISVSDLNQLPDVSIGDSISRLPGLTALRDPNNGTKSTISLRGMGPALTLGTLNGRDLATPNPERNIRYDQFPTELVGGVIVYKSQMASLVEGGVSGSIDIQTVRPLDYKKNTLAVSLLGSYNQAGDQFAADKEYGIRGSVSYIGRFADNTLGIAIGYAGRSEPYNELRVQHASFRPLGAGYGDLDQNGTVDDITYGMYANLRTGTDTRHGGFGIVEWKPSDKIHLNLDALVSKVKLDGRINGVAVNHILADGSFVNSMTESWGNYSTGPVLEPWRANTYTNIVVDDNRLIAGTIQANGFQDYGISLNPYAGIVRRNDNLWSLGGNLLWEPTDRLDVVTDVAYSHVKYRSDYWELRAEPLTQFTWGIWRTPDQSVTFDARENPPTWSTNVDLTDPNLVRPYSLTMPFLQIGRDKIFTYKNDFVYDVDWGGLDKIRFGARYVDRTKTNRGGVVGAQIAATNALLGNFANRPTFTADEVQPWMLGSYDGRLEGTFPQFITFDFDAVADRIFGGLDVTESARSQAESWKVNEKTFAGYGQLDLGGDGPLSANVGVRVIATRDKSSSVRTDIQTPGAPIIPITIKNDYTDVLPSMNITYRPTNDVQIRFGAAKTIARPPVEDLNAGFIFYNFGTPQANGGNPKLEPYRARQVDLGVEYYFGKNDYFALTGFYKQLQSYITTSTTLVDITNDAGATSTYTFFQPVNAKGGHVSGFEATFQKSFEELPAPLDGFGIYANYAYVSSNIAAGQNFTTTVLPLQGLAKHSGTAMLYYSKHGFAGHVAYNYRGSLARVVDGGALETDDSASYLDAQVSYEFRKGMQFVVQGQNLLNTPYRTYLDGDENIRGRYAEYGRIFYAGFRANF